MWLTGLFSKNQFTVATSRFQTNQSFLECNSELIFQKRDLLAIFLDGTSEFNIEIILRNQKQKTNLQNKRSKSVILLVYQRHDVNLWCVSLRKYKIGFLNLK